MSLKDENVLWMAEFGDSEHTGASGTAKLARNECRNVENRVRSLENGEKARVGPTATWQLTSALSQR